MLNKEDMLAHINQIRDRLAEKTVETETGAGLVRCKANGLGTVTSLDIDPLALEQGEKVVADLVLAAVNSVRDKARELEAGIAQEGLAEALQDMKSQLTGNLTTSATDWLKNNRAALAKYPNQYIALHRDGIVTSAETFEGVATKAAGLGYGPLDVAIVFVEDDGQPNKALN